MRYLNRAQMQTLDRRAIEKIGIRAVVLMENAGRATAVEALKMVPAKAHPVISVICGTGNNGGDGLVAARHLVNQGAQVKVFYVGHVRKSMPKDAAAINLAIITRLKIALEEITEIITPKLLRRLKHSDLIIDAIFGIGLSRPVTGFLKDLIDEVNRLDKPVLAIDVPSGLDCDQGIPLGTAIRAVRTVTLTAPKTGFRRRSARKYVGKLIVADIGIPYFRA